MLRDHQIKCDEYPSYMPFYVEYAPKKNTKRNKNKNKNIFGMNASLTYGAQLQR